MNDTRTVEFEVTVDSHRVAGGRTTAEDALWHLALAINTGANVAANHDTATGAYTISVTDETNSYACGQRGKAALTHVTHPVIEA